MILLQMHLIQFSHSRVMINSSRMSLPTSCLLSTSLSLFFLLRVQHRRLLREEGRKPGNQGYRVWLKSVGKEVAQCLCVPSQIYI